MPLLVPPTLLAPWPTRPARWPIRPAKWPTRPAPLLKPRRSNSSFFGTRYKLYLKDPPRRVFLFVPPTRLGGSFFLFLRPASAGLNFSTTAFTSLHFIALLQTKLVVPSARRFLAHLMALIRRANLRSVPAAATLCGRHEYRGVMPTPTMARREGARLAKSLHCRPATALSYPENAS